MSGAHPAPGFAVGALVLLLVAACGDDATTDHGLRRAGFESQPQGEPVVVAHDVEDGATYVARIRLSMTIRSHRTDGPPKSPVEGRAVIELRQRFERSDPERPPRSRIRLQYVQAEGQSAARFLAREVITGVLDHERRGGTRSIELSGGTPSEKSEALDMLGALLFAGLGGSPPWLPPRPIRVGEAWQLEDFVRPRALDTVARQVARMGVRAPRPTFSGSARLERVTPGPDGPLLEVALDALLEIAGPVSKDHQRSRVSIGDRQRGHATISARTGLPVRFQVRHERIIKEVLTSGARAEYEVATDIEGTVERADRGEGPGGG